MIINRTAQRGVTLIELMVVIVIVSILAAVAIPSYEDSVRKSRRTEAQTALTSVLQQQERFFMNNMTYSTDLAAVGFTNLSSGSFVSENGFYNVAASTCAGTPIARCVLLTATPQLGQADDGNMTLNSRGEKTATGKAAAAGDWH